MTKRIAPLMRFVPLVSPRFTEPRPLARLVDVFERIARGEEVHAVVSYPPRSKKTETAAHGVAWLLKQIPTLRVCYAMYGQRLAEKKSRRIRALAERARVPLDKQAASKADWRTGVDDGGVWATSVGGAAVGEGFDLQIWDDPVKDRIAAESALTRERTYEWATDTAIPRTEPGGSVVVLMHRWHPDDLGGRLVADGWEEINVPALNQRGEALDPERFSAEKLAKIRERIGDYAWESLYMGRPRARGGRVFGDVHTYETLPDVFDEIAIGCDFAYSIRTQADYSVAVVLGRRGDAYYVLDVVRMQVTAPRFRGELETLRRTYPGARFVSYIGGQERGVLDLFVEGGLQIESTAASSVGDKFTRAQPVAAAWNAGKVLIAAKRTAWRDSFVSEIAGFTGIRDRHDDQVDALAAAFDAVRVRESADDGKLHVVRVSDRSVRDIEQRDPWLRDQILARYRQKETP